VASSAPTLAGFTAFLRAAGFTTAVLPDNSVWIGYAFDVAMAIVNVYLAQVPVGTAGTMTIYTLAVYNLATSNAINFAQDVPGASPADGSKPPMPYFAWTRRQWNVDSFVSGVVNSASDEGTSSSWTVPKPAEEFTLADLQLLKDPWGRTYLQLAQNFGTLWNFA
jgi:hypothetical protein